MKVQLWATEQKPLRLDMFMPHNNGCLVFRCGEASLTQYGLPAEKAWAMFDLWATPETEVYERHSASSFAMSDADAPARLAKLRAETMGQPVVESEAA